MERYLYSTAVPVLLDGGRIAGRTARLLYARHGLEPHCFAPRRHPLTAVYTRRHVALPFTRENDAVNLRLLKAFAEEWGTGVGILSLIPCAPEAAAFLTRVGQALEEDYVLLESPPARGDPLRGLIQRHDTK